MCKALNTLSLLLEDGVNLDPKWLVGVFEINVPLVARVSLRCIMLNLELFRSLDFRIL